ncbi:MAG: hypothetical protein A3K66_06765 [Euryarchaeota archaeon RBG_16_67_27]|nr:MAG: hypothetical protein A3K66_06765 [Euryarchaeota archaeon RBG_16_67_27]
MTGIVAEDVDTYVDRLANRGDSVLAEVEREGRTEGWPIVGAAEGSLLHILARSLGARRILELGTAIGYSGTWLARALPSGGELLTVEADPKTAERARRTFERTGVADRVSILIGLAEDVLADLAGPFDLIFNDIDKEAYPAVLDPCIRRIRVGGLLVTDNVLWSGEVARAGRSRETKAIRAYNERLARDPRMIASILPLRDGVSVAVKVRE